MKEISEVTCVVVTTGLYQPLAECLATKCKRVILWSPEQRSAASVYQACVGDGFDTIERVKEFWPIKKDIDLFCFPDVEMSGLQLELESQGFAVWGSRTGDGLELKRERFLEVIKDLGLDVPQLHVCEGMDSLREYLRNRYDQYIKISRFRGNMETKHWRSWSMDENWLDWLAYTLGPIKDILRFLVFEEIETDLEIGGDTYCVAGKWPQTMLHGIECKDTTYISAVTKYSDMPEQLREILEAFAPSLSDFDYRNQWSMEVRIKDDKSYFIDPTCRGGMPSSGSQQLVWSNFPEIIWAGANGELLEPEPAAKFTLECMVSTTTDKESWDVLEFDPKLFPWFRPSTCAFINGRYCFPPDEFSGGDLGWLVTLGDTPSEALDKAKELADLLPDGCDAKLENMVGLIKEVQSAEKEGIEFTEAKIPSLEEVVSD